ncbi:prepilin [Escherichia coli]|nr:prepilin [Escherichia coli O6]EGD4803642.1 prepilin [Escherichia coli]EQN45912.1 type 4 prepilin-like protein leader peptide-processing enzyme [Escherichia coli HVH 16 (4-7649002)]EGD4993931.1 prepilin [Escherichia coli]KYU12825.1 prepilin [Escherichia coli]
MTMLLPLFILVGFIAGYFVNVMAYHLSPLEDKTALTFRQVLVHFWQKNMPGMIQCP